ncbi:hypothetical protein GOBAR_DD12954 [Gossypium barbadense]|nr:hypothetical protein GOBAR_DD12954 [Gossypium barbadense]
MDQYQKVEKPKVETPINENELRIIEKGTKKIVLKATDRAINKTVMIAELIMVYGALRMTVKIFLIWNSKMISLKFIDTEQFQRLRELKQLDIEGVVEDSISSS